MRVSSSSLSTHQYKPDGLLATFGEIEGDLNRLIGRFGLPDSRKNASLPFWHLRNDGLWEIDRPELVRTTTSGDAYRSDLREHDIRGGLVQEFLEVLDTNPDFAWRVVQSLLNDYFPPSFARYAQGLREGTVTRGKRSTPGPPLDQTTCRERQHRRRFQEPPRRPARDAPRPSVWSQKT